MAMVGSSPARREWKFCVPSELVGEIGAALSSRTRPDPYGKGPEGLYRVHSLYYDTPDRRFYHETRERLRVRRKLRVRSYGAAECFLEIKRKLNSVVVKERVPIHGSQLADALDGADPAAMLAGRPESDLRTLERFRFNLKTLGLVPTLLVSYDRLAMLDETGADLRITLDRGLGGRAHPGPDALFEDGELVPFAPLPLLEFKFSDRPPRWLMDVVARFQLKRSSYSKYCEGLDQCGEVAARAAWAAKS